MMIRKHDANTWSTHQLLSMAARLVERRQDRALAALGLTHAAVIALQCVAAGPLNQERLAAQIKVQSQSLGKVLARLEATGLVTRTRSPVDRRSIEVAITEAGRRALDDARRAERSALPPGISRRRTLHAELARVIDFFPDRSGSPPESRRGPQGAFADTGPQAPVELVAEPVDLPVEPPVVEPAEKSPSRDVADDEAEPNGTEPNGTEPTGTEPIGTETPGKAEARGNSGTREGPEPGP